MNDYDQKKADRIERVRAAGEKLRADGNARYERGHGVFDRIPLGQPLVGSPSNMRRDRNRREKASAAIDKGFALIKEGDDLLRRADAAEQNTAISSDDPEAITKLRAQLSEAEERAARITESVKRARKVERPWSAEKFAAAGVCSEVAKACLLLNIVPSLNTNASASVRRLKARIAELEAKATTTAPVAEYYGDAEVSEDREANRVMVRFPGRVPAEVHSEMRSAGFVWARSTGAYQRKASAQAWHCARYALRRTGYPVNEPKAPAPPSTTEADPERFACPDGDRCHDPECIAENARRAALMA